MRWVIYARVRQRQTLGNRRMAVHNKTSQAGGLGSALFSRASLTKNDRIGVDVSGTLQRVACPPGARRSGSSHVCSGSTDQREQLDDQQQERQGVDR